MKQYKLKNKSTNEEVLCTRVAIDRFDYYVSDEKIKPSLNDYYVVNLYDVEMNETLVFEKVKSINEVWVNNESVETTRHINNCRKILCCNNPSIDIPHIVNEVTEFVYEIFAGQGDYYESGQQTGRFEGWIKHSETHTLSDDEVIEFNDWCIKNYCCEILFSGKWYKRNGDDETEYTSKELLQLFKEQQIKTLIYE